MQLHLFKEAERLIWNSFTFSHNCSRHPCECPLSYNNCKACKDGKRDCHVVALQNDVSSSWPKKTTKAAEDAAPEDRGGIMDMLVMCLCFF